jgi:hypothetical protein
MVAETLDLWSLVRERSQVDPVDLSNAIVHQVHANDLDYRSRLLIRDSVDALRHYWGNPKFDRWFQTRPYRQEIEAICGEEFEKVGFPTLRKRIMDKKTPDQIRDYFRTLSTHIREPIKLHVAGSCALILPGFLVRGTDVIDVVDEVPKAIREQYSLLDELSKEFGLILGHVQRHYFPAGWEPRSKWFDDFGQLAVYIADVYDVFLSKLFSSRIKDLGDMRTLVPQIDKAILVERFQNYCSGFVAAPRLKEIATNNWSVLFGEPLPEIPAQA